MTLHIASINVNGLRDKKKRMCIFSWLSKRKYDIICLQETHGTDKETQKWENEWKTFKGSNSIWNNWSSESRGVGVLFMIKKPEFKITKTISDREGRDITVSIKNNDFTVDIKCIYTPNNGVDRKQYFNSLKFDELAHHKIICGDFNCTQNKQLDSIPCPYEKILQYQNLMI